MTLEEAARNIGRSVTFTYPGERWSEDGVITSVNAHWVFVRYGTDSNSKATAAAQLKIAEVTA